MKVEIVKSKDGKIIRYVVVIINEREYRLSEDHIFKKLVINKTSENENVA